MSAEYDAMLQTWAGAMIPLFQVLPKGLGDLMEDKTKNKSAMKEPLN